MIVYGYVKDYKYSGDGTMLIQVRIPNIHGPYVLSDYTGKRPKVYVPDSDLPWYPSLILPHTPTDGDVVAVASLDGTSSHWLVIGLTGGSYGAGAVNV